MLVPLGGKKYPGMHAVIDKKDYGLISGSKWHAEPAHYTFYARATRGGEKVYMHRLIAGLRSVKVDHRDGNGLNNRRSNLRSASSQQNGAYRVRRNKNNTSGLHGVSKTKCGRWMAQITYNRGNIFLGNFKSKLDAARAYDEAAEILFGQFATFNFPKEKAA